MLQVLVDFGRFFIENSYQAAVIISFLFLFFFFFASYKIDRPFKDIFKPYSQLFIHSLLVSAALLIGLILMIKFISLCNISIFLLALSSVLIGLKYVDFVKEIKGFLIDAWLVTLNFYVIYLLVSDNSVLESHYLILYGIILSLLLYQQVNRAYKIMNQNN